MLTEAAKVPPLLVVDDAAGVLTLVDRIATALGLAVVRETNGRSALESVLSTRPDGAIIDVGIADIDGLTVLREIKSLDPMAHVILMTGAASVDSAIQAIKACALDYVTMPLDVERL